MPCVRAAPAGHRKKCAPVARGHLQLPTGGFFGFVTAQVSRFERDESGPVQSASLWPGCAKPVRCASSSVAPPLRPPYGHMIALGVELMLKEYRRPAAGHSPDPSVRAAVAIAPPGRWMMVDAKLTSDVLRRVCVGCKHLCTARAAGSADGADARACDGSALGQSRTAAARRRHRDVTCPRSPGADVAGAQYRCGRRAHRITADVRHSATGDDWLQSPP